MRGIEKELKNFENKQVFQEVLESEVPAGARVIGTTTVLRQKGDAVKARICLQDVAYNRREDVFSPSSSTTALRALLVILLRQGLVWRLRGCILERSD